MTNNFKILPSNPYPLGVRREGKTIFASMVSDNPDCGLCLFSSSTQDAEAIRISFPSKQHMGQVYFMSVRGISSEYDSYALFKGADIVAEEHGRLYKKSPYGEPVTNHAMRGVFYNKDFDWEQDQKPEHPFSESVFYGLHVRGFTNQKGSKTRHKGTFLGIADKLDYLKDLGVTSLVLMPAYEFLEKEAMDEPAANYGLPHMRHLAPKESLNYWGYKKGFYYAPKANYAFSKDPVWEFKTLVKKCHQNGIELFMQFYFPGDVLEPEIIPILEYWASCYHVDGFQIMAGHINKMLLTKAPTLQDVKFIFSDYPNHEAGGISRAPGGAYKACTKRILVFGDNTSHDFRRFLKGDEFSVDAAMYHLQKNHSRLAYLNGIADYNSFRVADLVSYDYKHNEANGENNADGNIYNHSWNCGVEGPTRKKEILQLRQRQMKNALALVFLSQGTPYLFMGDEMGFSQRGNNNPYNQDNEISWLNWNNLSKNKEIYTFIKKLLQYRKAHPILHMEDYLAGTDILGCGYPNLSFHGLEAYRTVAHSDRRELGMLLCGKYARSRDGKEDNMLYIAFNMHWEEHRFSLPKLKNGVAWSLALHTGEACESLEVVHNKGYSLVTVPARTIVILEA